MPECNLDRLTTLVQAHAQACLHDLLESGTIPRPESCLKSGSRWSVLLIAFPAPTLEGAANLSECERACLSLLARLTEPISGVLTRRELERRGLGIFGVATVKRALARLKALGIVANARKGRRGYYLPDTLPLFNRPLGA